MPSLASSGTPSSTSAEMGQSLGHALFRKMAVSDARDARMRGTSVQTAMVRSARIWRRLGGFFSYIELSEQTMGGGAVPSLYSILLAPSSSCPFES